MIFLCVYKVLAAPHTPSRDFIPPQAQKTDEGAVNGGDVSWGQLAEIWAASRHCQGITEKALPWIYSLISSMRCSLTNRHTHSGRRGTLIQNRFLFIQTAELRHQWWQLACVFASKYISSGKSGPSVAAGMQTKRRGCLRDKDGVLPMPAAIPLSPGKPSARGVTNCVIALLGCILHFFA